jgi:undecaprenyl-diphosphatase
MLSTLRDHILYWDYSIWYYINAEWHTPFLDFIVPFLRNQWTWAPLYLFLAIFVPRNFGKRGFIWCAGFLVTFALSDQVSAHLLKPIFHRTRPCNNPNLVEMVHTIVPCGSGYSFPSSHAANHFALAIFIAATLGRKAKWVWPVAILWAMAIAYAQVYVGVHFPLDVTVGAGIGIAIGGLTGALFNRRFSL